MRRISLAALILAVVSSGCAFVDVKHSPLGSLDESRVVTVAAPAAKWAQGVDFYVKGELPPDPVIIKGAIAAYGNAYSSNTALKRAMQIGAKKLECNVVCDATFNAQVTTDAIIYGSGLAFPVRVKKTFAHAAYGVYSPSQIGCVLKNDDYLRVLLVENAETDLRIGDRIIGIDGKKVTPASSDWVRALSAMYSSRGPGERVLLTVLDKGDEAVERYAVLLPTGKARAQEKAEIPVEQEEEPPIGICVVIRNAPVLNAPGSGSAYPDELPAGARIEYLGVEDGWYHFKTDQFPEGWVHEMHLDLQVARGAQRPAPLVLEDDDTTFGTDW